MNITIEKIFNKYKEHLSNSDGEFEGYFIDKEDFKLAVIEYATELLKYAAEKVELTGTWGKDSIIGKGLSTRDSNEEWISLYINEDSILNIINELK